MAIDRRNIPLWITNRGTLFLCIVLSLLSESKAHWNRAFTVYGIFGGGGGKSNVNKPIDKPLLPPPPPRIEGKTLSSQTPLIIPPPPPRNSDRNESQSNVSVVPPPNGIWGMPNENMAQNGGMIASSQGWEAQQPPAVDPWMYQQQYNMDWDACLQREQILMDQVQNLTFTIHAMEQRDNLHTRQLDVLTERCIEVEAQASKKHNQAQELRVNCTRLTEQVTNLNQELEEWRSKCKEYMDQREDAQDKIKNIEKELKKSQYDREDMALMVERHRIQLQQQHDGSSSRSRGKPKKKKRGFFAWLFGMSNVEDDDDLEELQEEARTTLLTALQRERSNVQELEDSVTVLERNNSAISQQVKSRDLIISELNDRVEVFEQDKVVLKAALKQLQKEMSDEAPKTQKLIDDLAQAKREMEILAEEMQLTVAKHESEVASLNAAIAQKELDLSATESNLTVIGNYVDKLEERMADFKVARRNLEKRERTVHDLEQVLAETKREKKELEEQVKSFEHEHQELKSLLQEMADDRSRLRGEYEGLVRQRSAMEAGEAHRNETLAKFEAEVRMLKDANSQWQIRAGELESELLQAQQSSSELLASLNGTEASTATLRHQIETLQSSQAELQETLIAAESAKEQLREELATVRKEAEARVIQLSQEAEDREEHARREMQNRISSLESNAMTASAEIQDKLRGELMRIQQESAKRKEEEDLILKNKVAELEDRAAKESAQAKVELQNAIDAATKKLAKEVQSSKVETPAQTERIHPAKVVPGSSTYHLNETNTLEDSDIIDLDKNDGLATKVMEQDNTKASRTDGTKSINATVSPSSANSSASFMHNSNATLARHRRPPPPDRNVPLRKLRKTLSMLTGLHGVVTPSTLQLLQSSRKPGRLQRPAFVPPAVKPTALATNRTKALIQSRTISPRTPNQTSTPQRNVTKVQKTHGDALRKFRKAVAKVTGMHGAISKKRTKGKEDISKSTSPLKANESQQQQIPVAKPPKLPFVKRTSVPEEQRVSATARLNSLKDKLGGSGRTASAPKKP